MKKLIVIIALLLNCALVNAQGQFTNSGNFQTFTGAQVAFFGNFVNNGTITDDGLNVTFGGSAAQSISGTSITTIKNLVVNCSASGIIMQQDLIIANTLELTAGPLNLNSRNLTINNSASTAVSRTAGYILSEAVNNASKVIWNIGVNTSSHVFPFGTAAASYIPFTLAVTAGNIGNVTVSTYPTATNNTPYPTTPVAVTNVNRNGSDNSANVVDRFWQIDKDGVSGTATLTFVASTTEVGTITTLQAQRWNSTTSGWDDAIAGQTSGANSATVSGVTTFSPWTMSGNSAPLPIELLSFTAAVVSRDVDLNWKTATEINNDFFTIQRSTDGKEFKDIGKVKAGTETETIQKYNYVDANAFSGRSYYRLKQTDFDGAFKFSEIRKVEVEDNEETQMKVTAFPNPTTNNEFTLNFSASLESPTAVGVYDVMGKIVYNQIIDQGVSAYTINLNNSPNGVYVVKTSNTKANLQQTVVLK